MLMDEIHVVNCGDSNFISAYEDIFNGDPATDVISMANYRRCTFILHKGPGDTGTATITVESCDDTTPSNTTAIAFTYRKCTSGDTFSAPTAATSSGFTTTAGADQVYIIEVDAANLDGTDKYVRLKMTEVADDPCDGGVIAILSQPRYAEDVPVSALS